jgi:hypothetical protein
MICLCLVRDVWYILVCISSRLYETYDDTRTFSSRFYETYVGSRRDFVRDCEVLWRFSWLFRVLVVSYGVRSQDYDTFL